MHSTTKATHTLLLIATLACALWPAAACPQDNVTRPVSAEPEHKIRFDNGAVRVYVVSLPAGKSTLMHEHAADSFAVVFSDGEMTNAPLGGTPFPVRLPSGTVGFTPAPKPYSHRVSASGTSPFHVAALELIAPPGGAPHANQRTNAPFTVLVENSRGRAFRYQLDPGQSTGDFPRSGRTAIFAVSGGRISETAQAGSRLWDFEPGHFRWVDGPEKLSVRNEGTVPVHLVEIEVF